jgi:DNA replication protein DnaC
VVSELVMRGLARSVLVLTPPSLIEHVLAIDETALELLRRAQQTRFEQGHQIEELVGWSHLDFLHHLLADQAGLRRARRIERLINAAKIREALPLSTFDWTFNPSIPRMKIEALAQGDFISRKQNVVFVGQANYFCLGPVSPALSSDRSARASSAASVVV